MKAVSMIWAKIGKVVSGQGQRARFTGAGRAGETFQDRPMIQQYGFASCPRGGQGILLRDGEFIVLIASEDAQYRIALEDGEVALFDDLGSKVHLRRGGIVEVAAATKAVITAPLIEISGDLTVAGNITADGTVHGKTEVKAGSAGTGLSTHIHTSGGPGSPTSPPTLGS